MPTLLPALTSILALVMAVALLDQWRERRQTFQLVWAVGMLFFGIASGCEAVAAASGWNEALYRTWYLTGAVLTAGWLGLGSAVLLARTRFGYTFGILVLLAGLITVGTQARFHYPDAGSAPVLYLIGAGLFGIAIALETYFQNERWPVIAAIGATAVSLLGIYLALTVPLVQPYSLDPSTGQPSADLFSSAGAVVGSNMPG